MNIYVTTGLKVFMNSGGENRTHAENSVKCIRAQPKVRNRTQKLKRMTLFLQRVFRRAFAKNINSGGVHFNAAVLPLRRLRTYQPQWLAFAIATASHLAHWYRTHRFCGACAAPMRPSLKERALICSACGLTVYPRISPAVIVAIHSGERLLLTHNPGLPPAVRWALVAGYIEIGETPEDTVHREVAEEVGLKVKNLRYIQSQPWAFTQSLLLGYSAELEGSDEIKIDGVELDEARWFARQSLPPIPNTVTLTNTLITAFKNRSLPE